MIILIYTTDAGEPEGIIKLAFGMKGVRIKFPDYTKYVYLQIANYNGRSIMLSFFRDGFLISTEVELVFNEIKELEYTMEFINEILIVPKNNNKEFGTHLVRLCIEEVLSTKMIRKEPKKN